GAVQWHFDRHAAPARPGRYLDQALYLERLQRFPHGSLADIEQLLQLVFARQSVARKQVLAGHQPFDLFGHQVAALGRLRHGTHGVLRSELHVIRHCGTPDFWLAWTTFLARTPPSESRGNSGLYDATIS